VHTGLGGLEERSRQGVGSCYVSDAQDLRRDALCVHSRNHYARPLNLDVSR